MDKHLNHAPDLFGLHFLNIKEDDAFNIEVRLCFLKKTISVEKGNFKEAQALAGKCRGLVAANVVDFVAGG